MEHPSASLHQLARLRGKERFVALVWGLVRCFAVAAVLFAICCTIDAMVDTVRETPFGLRVAMSILQPAVLMACVWFWLLRPLARGVSDDDLAQRVETEMPEFDHKLVTAIQLNRRSARTQGMSAELISIVTHEAEDLAARSDFRSLADTRRLGWSGGILVVPVLAALALFVYLRFDFPLAGILAKRQLLLDVEIPHHINLYNETADLWPAGDEVTVRYRVKFKYYVEEKRVGKVRVAYEGQPSEEYPLNFAEKIDDETAIFAARVPPTTLNFSHRAWLGDGRSRGAAKVVFEPRPVVTQIDAWVQLPDFVGKKPDGTAYETLQNQGEILGLVGSNAKVQMEVQKPVEVANLIRIKRGNAVGSEIELPAIPMEIGKATSEKGEPIHFAVRHFRVEADLLAYRIEVIDRNGFANSSPPRRGIALAPDEPPHVSLLPERFAGFGEAATEDTEVEGMPIPQGKNIRIAYVAHSNLGLSRARLVYRINEGDWNFLPLKALPQTSESGPFDPRKGAFTNSKLDDEVEFTAVPSLDPFEKPNDLEGGGRFDFKTRALKKKNMQGKDAELEIGDRVEFYVEVFDKNPAPNRQPGRSDARIKGIVSDSQFVDWVVLTLQSESRLKQLEEKQRSVFKRPE